MQVFERVEVIEPHVNDDECQRDDSSDRELLRRFVADGDESAFATLVSRHAGLVMGLCRRILRREQDAEDAFQATFLILARKAMTIRGAASLPAWLYQTAYRIALRAKAKRARRRELTFEVEAMTSDNPLAEITDEHQQVIIDEEFNRLPEKFRLPLFLCCVEGKSRDDAAEQLGISISSVKGRLERGRRLLRHRLALRGVTFSTTLGALALLQQSTQAASITTPSLITSTTQGGIQYAHGRSTASYISANAISLADSTLHTMSSAAAFGATSALIVIAMLVGVNSSMPDGEVDQSTLVVIDPSFRPIESPLLLDVTFEISYEPTQQNNAKPQLAVLAPPKNKKCCKKTEGSAVNEAAKQATLTTSINASKDSQSMLARRRESRFEEDLAQAATKSVLRTNQ